MQQLHVAVFSFNFLKERGRKKKERRKREEERAKKEGKS